MKISELIATLQAAQAEHGDLEVQSLVPEGPYARLEGPFEYTGIGYCDEEGEFLDKDDYDKRIAEMEEDETEDPEGYFEGPFYCMGALPV